MAKHDAIFDEVCMYSEKLQNALIDKLQIFWVDSTSRFQINPVRRGGVISYEVFDVYNSYEILTFKSKKKAMQYVVAELFNDEFDYVHYGFKKHKGFLRR